MSMRPVDLDASAADWLIEYPQLLRLFEELGLDYSCGGKSLRTACQQRGLDPLAVLSRMELFDSPERGTR